MDTRRRTTTWLRYVPPAAALTVAFVLQVIVVTDTVGTALATARPGTDRRIWYTLAGGLGVSVASSIEAGAAYLMALYDRHLRARDSVWQLRAGMVLYVALSALIIHWWLGTRGLPEMIAWVLGGMSASALWLWSRGSRWAQRQDMIRAGQIDPALPRLPTVSKVLHPIRWITTTYLISWEPVATTGDARARHAEWRTTRRYLKRSNPWNAAATAETADGSDSSSASSGTGTAPTSSAAAVAAPRSTRPSSRRSRPAARKTSGSRTRTDTELISLIVANGWTGESLNQLSSRLRIGKRRAQGLRRAAQHEAGEHSPPDPEPEPVPNGQPTHPEHATAAVLETTAGR